MAFAFEKLLVYQKAVDFADHICAATEQFPRGCGFLVDQLNRAALSIAANIAEGNGRFTKRDRKNFIGIARGSIQEWRCPGQALRGSCLRGGAQDRHCEAVA
jgi:four helix bundle protein